SNTAHSRSHLNALVKEYRDHPVTFLALTDEDDVPLLQRFLKQTPIEGLVGIDVRSETFRRYGVAVRPTTILVDAAGIVQAVLRAGRLNAEMLDLLIAGKPIPAEAEAGPPVSASSTLSSESILELSIKPAAPAAVSGFSPGFMGGKGNTFEGRGLDVKRLASLAYGFSEDRIVVAAPLAGKQYDVSLTVPGGLSKSSDLLKQVLKVAFDVHVQSEMRLTEVYVLSVAPTGTRNLRQPETSSRRIWHDGGRLTAISVTLGDLAGELASILGKPVIDETGMRARHDFELQIGDGSAARRAEFDREYG
ncbi:MAG: TIGR03435 family protein, partial [Bryobacteraceae bacterium]